MKIFGFEITRTKAYVSTGPSWGRWLGGFFWPHEAYTGAWQQNVTVDSQESVLAHSAVFACATIIASDVSKLPVKLMRRAPSGIWSEITAANPLLALLRKPNRYCTAPQFFEQWMHSRELHGNAYVLKERDRDGRIVALYVLSPYRVKTLVAPDGSVYYEISPDNLSGVDESVTLPASELIHDRVNTLFHPLVGISPLFACAWSATLGNKIVRNSAQFFQNMSRPGGILTAPGAISDQTAANIKAAFEANHSGDSIGRLAVVGDGLKYESLGVAAEDSQLVEQLGWTAADVARAFRIPAFMIGAGAPPAGLTVEALTQQYYSQVLQSIIENVERVLDDGLELPPDVGVEFDLDTLLRMDTASRYAAYSAGVGGGWLAPNEARAKENLPPVDGGESPLAQQQNFSLAALAKRDARPDPFAPSGSTNAD